MKTADVKIHAMSILHICATTWLFAAALGCETDWDCSAAGACVQQNCRCDPGFDGPTCARLAFKPVPSAGHAFRPGRGFTTWGGSPIQADNRSMYYLFASVNFHGTLATWWNTSVIVTATSTSPAGPYYWDRKSPPPPLISTAGPVAHTVAPC